MSNYQSSSSLYSAASPVVGCDAWANIRVGNGSTTDQLRASSGIQGVTYISSGVHGISFSVPTRLGGGGYVILFTPEVKDHTVPVVVQSTRNLATANIGATAPGTTAGVRYTTYKFPGPVGAGGNTATSGDFNVGGGNDDGVHLNTAVFGFKTNSDLRTIAIANYLKYSNNFTDSSWSNVTHTVAETTDVVSPLSYLDSKVFSVQSTGAGYVSQTAGTVNKQWCFSVYAKSGTGVTFDLLCGGVGNNFGYKYNLQSGFILQAGTIPSGGGLTGYIVSLDGTSGGWKRCVMSFSTPVTPAPLFRIQDSGKIVYVTSSQLEEGSRATQYIPTQALTVYGNQDAKKQLFPGASGFGVTGATYNSHMPALLSARSPVAYGTVVIPPNTGTSSPVSAYIEGGYNVLSGVSAGANSVFDITFAKPLVNANYCVILSGEVESSVVNYGNLTDYSMLLVGRGYKTVNGFRVISLKQNSTDNSWNRSSVTYQSGFKERIHFMVFGGGTYGQP